MKYTTFIFLGKPGSGKGTQAKLLAEKTGFEILTPGEVFRELSSHDTIIGRKVNKVIDKGLLMPHWFAEHIFVSKTLSMENNEGLIFDGTARKKPEAELFHDVMRWLERPYKAIYVDISDEEAMKRILKRAENGERDDDKEDVVKIRLKEYYDEAWPAIEFFKEKDCFVIIDGERSIEDIHKDIMQKIESA